MKNNSFILNNQTLGTKAKKQNKMDSLIAAKDFSPIEDAETIKNACKGVFLQFYFVKDLMIIIIYTFSDEEMFLIIFNIYRRLPKVNTFFFLIFLSKILMTKFTHTNCIYKI
jgi:tRNA(His) 5'-end guanylyltransferase